jgi:hypothetical protein
VEEPYHSSHASKTPQPNSYADIPQKLKSIPRWMGTRFEPRQDGKLDKPPYRVRVGESVVKADKTDPNNWASFDDAVHAVERGAVNAIGFVFTKDDPFFVVDADKVIDHETGEIREASLDVIHTLDSYAEFSCSGRGIHVIGEGKKPEGARCKSRELGIDLELYDGHSTTGGNGARFVVMTGKRFPDTPPDIESRYRELDEVCRVLWPEPEKRNVAQFPTPPPALLSLPDEELLIRARRARGTGVKFRMLFDDGDRSAYNSPSEADYSLLNMLIFWCAGDRERIIRLFEASALYRPNKHRGYVRMSVDNALSSYTGNFYRPRRAIRVLMDEDEPLTPYLELLLDPSAWRGRKGASAYKTYAAAVSIAAERGIFDNNGNLRLGCDVRTLAERAGAERATLCKSALPYLVQEMKLLRWQRGKGKKAGYFVLPKPKGVPTNTTKVIHTSKYFSGVSGHSPKRALETLKLLIRMRGGRSKRARLPRLGMVAMFVAVAMCNAPQRGQTVAEIATRTGRRGPDVRRVCNRLVSAEVLECVGKDVYRLTNEFRDEYLRELEESGVTYSERCQRMRHEADRVERDEWLKKRRRRKRRTPSQEKAGAEDAQPRLRGKEYVERTLREQGKRARERWVEEQRCKVGGETPATFLAEELKGVSGARWADVRQRYHKRGGDLEELWRTVHRGPFEFRRERDGHMYVYHEGKSCEPYVGPNARLWQERMEDLDE